MRFIRPAALFQVLAAFLLAALSFAPVQPVLAQEGLPREAALDLQALQTGYPGLVRGMETARSGRLDLVLADGRRFVYDDGLPATPAEALESPDLRDMMAQAYPLGMPKPDPAPDFDPGRRRMTAFLQAVYGRDRAEVEKSLVMVNFLGSNLPFNARNGAADALRRVAARLEAALAGHPEWRPFIFPLEGTFAWRPIAATSRLSMHSLGIALDLNPELPYWLTHPRTDAVLDQVRAFPPELVEIFEAEGFVWGGAWFHFDPMHFEYRPELIAKARAAAKP